MQLHPGMLLDGVAWFVVFVFSTTLHEAGHALAALRLGDPTAYRGGQVTLNPLPHIQREPFGMLLVPILSFFLMGGSWMFGWASAPYDPLWALRHPRRSAMMAAAGPLGNLALVLVAALAIRLGIGIGLLAPPDLLRFDQVVVAVGAGGAAGLAKILSILFSLNLVLLLFNLIPMPPLDGSAVVQLLMHPDLARRFAALMAQPMWGLVGLLLAWRVFPYVFGPIFTLAIDLLYPGLYR